MGWGHGGLLKTSVLTVMLSEHAEKLSGEVMTRKRLFEIVDVGGKGDPVARMFDILMVSFIFLNVVAVVLETVEELAVRHAVFFHWFEVFSVAIFTIEYAVRIWVCVEESHNRFRHPVTGRLRYMATPMAIIDLVAILPFYLSMFVTMDLRFLRVFRLLRILKLTRYSKAIDTLAAVFRNERRPLLAALTIMLTLLVFLSGIVFFLEKDAQPEAFASIPHAMWWGMATLTTVGYGDVVPVTPWGKLVGAMVTLIGIGMFALPAAILASGFAREAKQRDFVITWNLVAQFPLFSHLPAIRIAEIAELLRPRIAAPGEIIVHKDSQADNMFFILSGEVELDTMSDPVRLRRGDYFGEIALLFDKPRTATVTATISCQLLVLDRADFHELLERDPHLREEVMRTAEQRLADSDRHPHLPPVD